MRFKYRSLHATVAQPKNCPFGVNTTIQLKDVTTTSHNKANRGCVFLPRSVPVFADVVTHLSSIVELTGVVPVTCTVHRNDKFLRIKKT